MVLQIRIHICKHDQMCGIFHILQFLLHKQDIQIQQMVKTMLGLKGIPRPDDAADALAVALCHSQTNKLGGLFSI